MSAARIIPDGGCPGVVLGIMGERFAVPGENNSISAGGAYVDEVGAGPDILKAPTSYPTKANSLGVNDSGGRAMRPVET